MIDQKLKRGISYAYLSQAVAFASGFGYNTLVTRYWGIDELGKLVALASAGALISNLLTFRSNEAVPWCMHNLAGRTKSEQRFIALKLGLLTDLLVCVPIALIYLLAAKPLVTIILGDPASLTAAHIYALNLIAVFMRGSFLGLLVGDQRFTFINSISMAENLLKVLLPAGWAVYGGPKTLTHLVALGAVPVLVGSVFILVAGLRGSSGSLLMTPAHYGEIRRFIGFSGATFASSSLKALQMNLDSLVISSLTSPKYVGIYTLIRQFFSPLVQITSPIAAQLYPRFLEAARDEMPSRVSDLIRGFNRRLVILVPSVALVSICVSQAYLYVNDLPPNRQTLFAAVCCALGQTVITLNWWARPFSNAFDPKLSVVENTIASCVSIVLMPTLIALVGYPGAALALFVVAMTKGLYWMRVRKGYEQRKWNTPREG